MVGSFKFLFSALLLTVITSGLIFPAMANNGEARITVEPPNTNVTVSTEFTVDIWIRDLPADMISFSFVVNWDPTLMEYVSHQTYVLGNGWTINTDNVFADRYEIGASGPSFGEDARWVTITFHCLGAGSSLIDTGPSDMSGAAAAIPHDRGAATLNQIEPAPVGGITVPVNKLEVLIPYLALAGLIIITVSAIEIKKRKQVHTSI